MKQTTKCTCLSIRPALSRDSIKLLDFTWPGAAPRGGQFFMVKPCRSGVFLPRPLSAAGFTPGALRFLVARRGQGTEELLALRAGDEVDITGPLGVSFAEAAGALPREAGEGPLALVAGGVGIAPLACYAAEAAAGGAARAIDVYAGFRSAVFGLEDLLPGFRPGAAAGLRELVVATEDGSMGCRGRIPGFFSPAGYGAVYACGPEPLLRVVAAACREAGVACLVSLERRMACGVGACLGCAVSCGSREGVVVNRRCCTEGPVFDVSGSASQAAWL